MASDEETRGASGRGPRWLWWLAGLWFAATALSIAVHGLGDRQPPAGGARPGDARTARADGHGEDAGVPRWIDLEPAPDASADDVAAIEARLRALGYLDAYEEAPGGSSGIQLHDAGRAQPGLNLLVSSHAPEAVLIDMAGRVRHRWHLPFETAFPAVPSDPDDARRFGWRRAHAFPNGDLLVIFEGLGLFKIDRDSKLLWARPGGFHHDLDVAPDGRIHTLWREVRRLPRIQSGAPVLEDFVHVLSPGGELLARHSLLEAIEASGWAPFLVRKGRTGDLLHTNAVTWLDGAHAAREPGFARGHLLLSSLSLDLLFTLDPSTGRAAWALAGPWLAQHEPQLLANGRLLVFDNLGGERGSRILEVDPWTSQIVWRYEDPRSGGFASVCCGTVTRLANGNTLIVESTRGRAFEVTQSGEAVWRYQSPHRRGSNEQLVAVLFDVVRLPEDFFAAWLAAAPSEERQPGRR